MIDKQDGVFPFSPCHRTATNERNLLFNTDHRIPDWIGKGWAFRAALVQPWWHGGTAPEGLQVMVDVAQVEGDLLAFVRREIFAAQVEATMETDLIAAGFDSMSLVRVLLFIEMTYGLWIPQDQITSESLRNVRSLAATAVRLLHEQ